MVPPWRQRTAISCRCGKEGCLDSYLSGRGFELIYEHYFGEKKKAIEICRKHTTKVKPTKAAKFYVDRFMELWLSILRTCLRVLTHVLLLGGGLSNFELIYERNAKAHT